MRKEIKYEFQLGLNINLEKYLLLNSCKEIFKSRKVNSIYYDDDQLNLFKQNIDGIGFRRKFRCRFYNEGDDGIIIENKLKFNEFNEKKFLKEEKLKKISKIRNQDNLIFKINQSTNLSVPALIPPNYFPKVFVSYKRKYFQSRFAQARITIDTNISFSKVLIKKKELIILYKRLLNHNILEVKFESDTPETLKIISKIVNEFNLTYSKCSKYSKAIELIY